MLISIGGRGNALRSFEHIDLENGQRWERKNLSFGIQGHCLVKIDAQTVMITGGYRNWDVSKKYRLIRSIYKCL